MIYTSEHINQVFNSFLNIHSKHPWSQWYRIPQVLVLQRHCSCGLQQRIHEGLLGDPPAKLVHLFEDFAKMAEESPHIEHFVPPSIWLPPPAGDDAFFHGDTFQKMNVHVQEHIKFLKKEMNAQLNQVSPFIKMFDEEMSAAKKDIAAQMQKEVEKMFPGTVEVDPPEADLPGPPEITDNMYEDIVNWLNSPFQKGFPAEYWEHRIAGMAPMGVAKQVPEGEVFSPSEVMPSWYTIVIRRVPIALQDDRWWMECAIRVDTGEPIATVNHQGSFQQWKAELQGEPF